MPELKSIALMCFMFLLGLNISSCSSDDCSQSDWVGSYTKINEDCDNGETPLFEDDTFLAVGSCDNCISTGSISLPINEDDCSVILETPLFGDLIYKLDGNSLSVTAPLINCSALYEKQ